MAKLLWLRMVSAVGLLSLAFFLVGMDPFVAAAPTAGALLKRATAPVSAAPGIKGDRLPAPDPAMFDAPDWEYEFGALAPSQPAPRPRAQMPIGCDPAFSPIFSSRRLPNVYRRCTV